MCGIAGSVDFAQGAPAEAVLRSMVAAITHRGPDAEGVWRGGLCGLAHRRLSIIDLEGSHQPMVFPDGDHALVYNGELYNYRELRDDLLAAGATFHTTGDTEVILEATRRHWSEAPKRFDGMFALGAWDMRGERLLLARDPIGIKPLFYATPRPDLLVFGSEIKAVLRHPEVARELDRDGLRQVIRFRSVYGRRTLYGGIQQLEPGGWLQFDRAGLAVGRHYDLTEGFAAEREALRELDEAQLVARGRDILRDAVRKRLIADVPVGAFLSGGIDSSLIVALIKECRAETEETCTFSVGFRGDEHSELPHARAVADALGTRHIEVALGEADYMSSFARLTQHRDAPISEPADLAIARMSTVARDVVKVVLSGEGSDEVFCGYPKYRFARASALLRFGIRTFGSANATRLASLVGADGRRVQVATRALEKRTELERLVQWFSYLERQELTTLLPGLDWTDSNWERTTESQRAILASVGDADALVRMQTVDCLSWLPGNLLERGDRMTMAAGLEARIPFLDRRCVAFGFALNERYKVRGETLKWIVRRWADGLVPREIIQRRKWGFRVPLAEWFRGGMRDMVWQTLLDPNGLCGTFGYRAAVERLLESHDSGRIDANLALWTLLASEVWYQEAFRRNEGSVGAR